MMKFDAVAYAVRKNLYHALTSVRTQARDRGLKLQRRYAYLAASEQLHVMAKKAEADASIDALILYEASVAARRAAAPI